MTISITELYGVLQSRMPYFKDKQYGFAEHNKIGSAEEYLFDTPHDYWTGSNNLPENHSARLPAAMGHVVAKAERWVDIVTMDEPKGDFRKQIEQAFVTLAKSQKKITVRFLLGRQALGPNLALHKILEEIAAKLPASAGFEIHMAQFRWRNASWNHAKLIAVDGEFLLTGGHNMWDHDYLERQPVFDLSMRIDGPIALGGHQFADGLWEYVKTWGRHEAGWATYSNRLRLQNGKWQVDAERPTLVRPELTARPQGSLRALWTTNPGWGVWQTIEGSGMIAFIAALQTSTHCRMSIQDLGSDHVGGKSWVIESWVPRDLPFYTINCRGYLFNLAVMDNLAAFLAKSEKTEFHLIMTPPKGGGRGYGHGVPLEAVFDVLSQRLNANHGFTREAAEARLNERMFLKEISFDKDRQKWPEGGLMENHAKFWMLDDTLCYVGSENLYPCFKAGPTPGNLQEFGVITELNGTAREMILENYFAPMFKYGIRTKADAKKFTW